MTNVWLSRSDHTTFMKPEIPGSRHLRAYRSFAGFGLAGTQEGRFTQRPCRQFDLAIFLSVNRVINRLYDARAYCRVTMPAHQHDVRIAEMVGEMPTEIVVPDEQICGRSIMGCDVERCWGAGEESAHMADRRSEEHTSELQSLMRISYAVFC